MLDKQYLARREAEEQAAAERATSERVRQCHLELAAAYHLAQLQDQPRSDEPANSTVPRDLNIL